MFVTAKVRNFKFGVQQAYKEYYQKIKIRGKRAWPRSCDLLLNFRIPLYISGSAEATNVKFVVQFAFI